MKNRTEPMQKFREFTKEMKSNDKLELELGPNEFTDKKDRIGLFSLSDPEPHSFLTLERYELVDLENNKDSQLDDPYQSAPTIHIVLSPIKRSYERSAFTLMMVLGELGGIFGAIVSIPSLFISHFIQNLFMSSVTDLMPGKQKIDLYQESSIKDKIA